MDMKAKVTEHGGAQLNPPQRKRRNEVNLTPRGGSVDSGLRRLMTEENPRLPKW